MYKEQHLPSTRAEHRPRRTLRNTVATLGASAALLIGAGCSVESASNERQPDRDKLEQLSRLGFDDPRFTDELPGEVYTAIFGNCEVLVSFWPGQDEVAVQAYRSDGEVLLIPPEQNLEESVTELKDSGFCQPRSTYQRPYPGYLESA